MTRKIYFHGAYRMADVPAAKPVLMSLESARNVLARIGSAGSFMGVEIDEKRTLQLYQNEDATVHAEVLFTDQMRTRYSRLNVPLAGLVLEAVYLGRDVEQTVSFSGVKWSNDELRSRAKGTERVAEGKAAQPGATDNPGDAQ